MKISRMSFSVGKIVQKKVGEIIIFKISNPAKRNAISPKMAKELSDCVDKFESDSSLKVAVIHGEGGNFSSGFDLSSLIDSEEGKISYFDWNKEGNGPIGPSRRFIKKPLIAAISGFCVAGAFELSLACDVRIMSKNAKLGLLNRRFGIPCMNGGSVRLFQILGLGKALDISMTGRQIDSSEALQLGLVSRVVPDSAELADAMMMALRLCSFPQKALNHDRRVLHTLAFGTDYEKKFRFEWDGTSDIMQKEGFNGAHDFKQGKGKKGKLFSQPVKFNLSKLDQ